MMFQWIVFTCVCLACLVVGAIVGIIADRWIRETEQLEANPSSVHGRHAKREPRTSLVQPPEPDYKPIVWVDEEVEAKFQARRGMAPSHVAASGIAPVILPEPGTYLPQPGRDSGDGTETFARLELPATTGEMAAVTDDYIAQMAIDEETFRLGLAT